MVKRSIVIVLLVTVFFPSRAASFGNNPNFYNTTADQKDQREYMRENAAKPIDQGGYYGGHDTITSEAALLKKDVHRNNQDFKKWIDEEALHPLRVGTHDEDSTKVTVDVPIVTPDLSLNLIYPVDIPLDDPPIGSTGWGGFFNHFYDPKTGEGLKGRGTPAPERAKDYIKEIKKLTGCAAGGIAHMPAADKKKAYQYFGKAMHLLQDMAVPSHTQDDAHPIMHPFEKYINENWNEIVTSDAFRTMVTPETYINGNYSFTDIGNVMRDLANISSAYPNEEKLYDDLGEYGLVVNQARLQGNVDNLVPPAILYTAGFIDSIYDYMNNNTSDQAKCDILYHFIAPVETIQMTVSMYLMNSIGRRNMGFQQTCCSNCL